MTKPKLSMLSVDGLVSRLNLALADSDDEISIDGFKEMSSRTPWWWRNWERGARGIYTLTQIGTKFPYCLVGMSVDVDIGYICVDTGDTNVKDPSSYAGGIYEAIELGIYRPLKLKGDKVIPDFRVKVTIENEYESYEQPVPQRRNGLFSPKDLDYLVPTDWFLRPKTENEILREALTGSSNQQ